MSRRHKRRPKEIRKTKRRRRKKRKRKSTRKKYQKRRLKGAGQPFFIPNFLRRRLNPVALPVALPVQEPISRLTNMRTAWGGLQYLSALIKDDVVRRGRAPRGRGAEAVRMSRRLKQRLNDEGINYNNQDCSKDFLHDIIYLLHNFPNDLQFPQWENNLYRCANLLLRAPCTEYLLNQLNNIIPNLSIQHHPPFTQKRNDCIVALFAGSRSRGGSVSLKSNQLNKSESQLLEDRIAMRVGRGGGGHEDAEELQVLQRRLQQTRAAEATAAQVAAAAAAMAPRLVIIFNDIEDTEL